MNKQFYIHAGGIFLAETLVGFSFVTNQAEAQQAATARGLDPNSELRNAVSEGAPPLPARDDKALAKPCNADAAPLNWIIVNLVDQMPEGGGYAISSDSIKRLISSIRLDANHLDINAEEAKPSFCSAATYLVFVSVLNYLNRRGDFRLDPGVMEKLLVRGEADGVGVWGRWNANGPGTARLFSRLHLGRNFSNIHDAIPGDFAKIYWNDQIGASEFGHSVIYLGPGSAGRDGIETIRYWSSNKGQGYGTKEVPVSKIKRMLFSRLEHPEQIAGVIQMKERDDYLAEMLKRNSTPEEMLRNVGAPLGGADADGKHGSRIVGP